jgi:hypothetical protein
LESRHFDQLRLAHFAPILPQLLAIKNRPPDQNQPEVDPAVAERLRAMGYLE